MPDIPVFAGKIRLRQLAPPAQRSVFISTSTTSIDQLR
jgi:hypothetical protein